MPPLAIRFRPPRVELPPALGWALARAFGPPEARLPPPAEPLAALAAARRFEIAARLAARLPRDRWVAELGEEGAVALRRERIAAVAAEVRLLDLARDVAAAAGEAGTPVALLKFAALAASGAAAPGSRPACDVDLLAPAAGAAALHAALRSRGWSASPLPGGGHQLAALASPAGACVELHLCLPGVRLAPSARSVTYADLDAGGLLLPLAGWPASCRVPAAEILAAHAVVHGIAQHGFAPAAYGQLKMVGDLIDLGWAGPAGGALAARAARLVAADVSAAEVAALERLARLLAAAAPADRLAADLRADGVGDEIVLLRHALAGRLDPRYQAALKLGLRPEPGDAPRALAAARALWSTVFLSRAQVAAIYGPPVSRWGYLGRRLARPFDLARRLAVYAAAARRVPGAAASAPATAAGPAPAVPSRILPPR